MRTWFAGMGGGVWALSKAGAALNKKKTRTKTAEKVDAARRCMIHTPGLVGRFAFFGTLPSEIRVSKAGRSRVRNNGATGMITPGLLALPLITTPRRYNM